MFDVASFQSKIKALSAVLPALGDLVQAAQVVAPNAAGLTKAGIVIQTVIAVEPALAVLEQEMAAAITGIVTAYRSDGTLPASTGTAQSQALQPPATTATAS